MSGSSNTIPGTIHACCVVDLPNLEATRGLGNLVVNGVGDFELTLDQPIDATEAAIIASVNTAGGGEIDARLISDSVLAVETFDSAGAPADRNFSVLILRP